MALIGTLQDFNLFSIFSMIKSQNKIGTLVIKNEDINIKIIFDSGSVIWVDSNLESIEDGIVPTLARLGIISHDEQKNILNVHNQTLKPMIKVALESKAITLKNIQESLYVQAMAIIYHLFLWTNGDYQFDSIIKDNPDRESFQPISIENILMEVANFIDEWPRVQKRLPDFSQILFNPAKASNAVNNSNNIDNDELRQIRDTPLIHEEEVILNYFEHPISIDDIIGISKYYELDTCKYIADLLEKGLLKVYEQETLPIHPMANQISIIKNRQMQIYQKPSVLFWPLVAAFAIVPVITYASKSKESINQGLYAIYSHDWSPIKNGQSDERSAFVSILKNVAQHNGALTIPAENSDNGYIKEAKKIFKQYHSDPLLSQHLNPARETTNDWTATR